VRPLARRGAALAITLLMLALAPATRAANIFENAGLPAFQVDPSMRSLAMGGASGAVFWGQGPNYWANPALHGMLEGIRYEQGARGLDSDIQSRRLSLGYGGVGLATAGPPFSGLAELEYSVLVSLSGLGDFDLSDRIHSWGIGASVSGLTSAIAGLRGKDAPALTRYVDFAFGYNHKTDESLSAAAVDWGVLARGAAPFQLGSSGVQARVEAAYGYSVQNANDATSNGSPFPFNRPHRHSVAARFAVDSPDGLRRRVPAWAASGLDPVVSLGGAWDREFISAGDGPFFSDESHLGGELGLANVLFLRLGRDGDNHNWGYGLGLPLGRMAGFQYDRTWQSGFSDLRNSAWSLWLNPVEIARTLRASR
jgi:hypothetical protein